MPAVVLAVVLISASCSSSDSTETADATTTSTAIQPTTAQPTTTQPTTTQPTTTTAPPSSTTVVDAPPAPPDDAPACVGADWIAVDAGPFGFWTPADLVDEQVQGIDSLVGRYVGGGLELVFDYGWYSPGIDELERFGATIAPVELGDVSGLFATAEGASAEYGSEFLTHLRVDGIPGVDPSNALWMGANYDDPALVETAECIVSTVRFL